MSTTLGESDGDPAYPIPISRLGHRYYLYNIAHISHLRVTHHILGTLVGSLPQSPQQNLFLGLPLELTPEEARLLVSKGVCCIVEDVAVHRSGLQNLSIEEQRDFRNLLQAEGREAAAQAVRRAGFKTESALSRLDAKRREKALKALARHKGVLAGAVSENTTEASEDIMETASNDNDDGEGLFSSGSAVVDSATASTRNTPTPMQLLAHAITPTTSYPPLLSLSTKSVPSPPTPPTNISASIPAHPFTAAALPQFNTPPPFPTPPPSPPSRATPEPTTITNRTTLPPATPSYPLFAHLHSLSYYMSPGLRFGCQYCVYPGDPLRFHSHFLAVGAGWDEEIDLLTLVGGGRLGTGVKKGFLLGGVQGVGKTQEGEGGKDEDGVEGGARDGEGVRCFCVEWGGM